MENRRDVSFLRHWAVTCIAAVAIAGTATACGSEHRSAAEKLYILDHSGATPPSTGAVNPYRLALSEIESGCTNSEDELADYTYAVQQRLTKNTDRVWSNLEVLKWIAFGGDGVPSVPTDCKEIFAFAGAVLETAYNSG